MNSSLKHLSLLWRILLSTSIAITLLFAATGWAVQNYAVHVSERNLEGEVRTSAQAYDALWKTRTHTLAAISRIVSSMSDVRAAFQTRDQATMRDIAQELWSRISEENAVFLVLSPTGGVIASLGPNAPDLSLTERSVQGAMKQFPAQVSGFLSENSRLFFVVLTPTYVQSNGGQALINILLAGFEVDNRLAASLKQSTHGSDFVFTSAGRMIASTMPQADAWPLVRRASVNAAFGRVQSNHSEYLVLTNALRDIEGAQIGQLRIVRSFAGARRALSELQRNVGIIWLIMALVGLILTYLMARRIVEPVKRLDRAASEVARRNYDYRVPVESEDELGRLAQTFNAMCESIQMAREELIRQERIATIGRLSSSIVHDLRNPLAAIYGGSEMLVDSDLPPQQAQRLARSIYKASQRMQELLQDLVNVARGKSGDLEVCRLADVVTAAHEVVAPLAESQGVHVTVAIPEDIELPLQRARMERVFLNLMNNSVEAMPAGGDLRLTARRDQGDVLIKVDDTGRGVSEQVRNTLFQPFASAGKKNGLGLGLALSRQTLLDLGGELWFEEKPTPGARFCIRLPGGNGASQSAEPSPAHSDELYR
jgi:Signal transduction histidine kinase